MKGNIFLNENILMHIRLQLLLETIFYVTTFDIVICLDEKVHLFAVPKSFLPYKKPNLSIKKGEIIFVTDQS